MESGTDVVIKFKWCPTVANTSGSDKYVLWRGYWNQMGATGTTLTAWNAVAAVQSSVIPDTEAAKTVHIHTFVTISGLTPGDFLMVMVYREANLAGDTYADDAFVSKEIYFEYVSDKPGETI